MTNRTNKTLVLITGPTAVGKTSVSISVARALGTEIVSADARQFFRELQIGSAIPTPDERSGIPHHFIGHLSVRDQYDVSRFESDALKVLEKLFSVNDHVVLTGGSGLYLDTLCHGLDDLPGPDPEIRRQVLNIFRAEGLPGLQERVRRSDPAYFWEADQANPKRLMRALEVMRIAGIPYSQLRTQQKKRRPFRIRRIVLDRPREELYTRINARTNQMVSDGLVEEAVALYRYSNLNALNTVGYKEIFAWLSGRYDLHAAIEKIKTNTRRFAKRQLTWFKRYDDALWLHPDEKEKILDRLLMKG